MRLHSQWFAEPARGNRERAGGQPDRRWVSQPRHEPPRPSHMRPTGLVEDAGRVMSSWRVRSLNPVVSIAGPAFHTGRRVDDSCCNRGARAQSATGKWPRRLSLRTSEIDRQALLLPIPETGRLRPAGAAVLQRLGHLVGGAAPLSGLQKGPTGHVRQRSVPGCVGYVRVEGLGLRVGKGGMIRHSILRLSSGVVIHKLGFRHPGASLRPALR